jgi:hypothetical protein
MWKSVIRPSLIGTILNGLGILIIYLIESRISWTLTILTLFWAGVFIYDFIKSKKQQNERQNDMEI